MADDLFHQLTQYLDKQLGALRDHVDDQFRQERLDRLKTGERITKQSQSFHEDMTRLNNRLDLVAAQVAKVGDDVTTTHDLVGEQSTAIERIERRVERDLDRLDDHGERIEALEDKTAHLTTTTS